MSENQKEPQYKLRWSEELRNKVVESAKQHSRSINAEICTRLEESFSNGPREPSPQMLKFKEQMDEQTKILLEQQKIIADQNERQSKILLELIEFQEWKKSKNIPTTKSDDDWS